MTIYGHASNQLVLIEFKIHSTGRNMCLVLKSVQEMMVWEFTDPRGESTIIILLNRHNIKLLSKFVSLYY